MLFYSALLITSLVVTLVILWLYNMIVLASKKFRESRGRVKSGNPTAHLNEKIHGRNVKKAGKAWAAYGHATPANLARTHPAQSNKPAPWGWSESAETAGAPLSGMSAKNSSLNAYLERKNAEETSVTNMRNNLGRPIRDDRPALAGTAYTPSQDIMDKLSNKDDDRPWGW